MTEDNRTVVVVKPVSPEENAALGPVAKDRKICQSRIGTELIAFRNPNFSYFLLC